MFLKETYKSKIKIVVTFDPVPEEQEYASTPCGACRHVIWEHSTLGTVIICGQYMYLNDEWKFVPKMEKYTIEDLYPKPFKIIKWD